MPIFLITCKMNIMRLGIASAIRALFPDAVLLHAGSRRECLRLLTHESVSLMISDGTVDSGPNLGMIRDVRALQPDIKTIMLLDDLKIDDLRWMCLAGAIDVCLRKDAAIKEIHKAILQVLSAAEA